MASKEKNRQKKLAKQKKKRLARKKALNQTQMPQSLKASAYTQYPFYECLVPDGLFRDGIGTIIVARKLPNNAIAMSAFIVDSHCLGVKNAVFRILSQSIYEHDFKEHTKQTHEGEHFEPVDPSCAQKIITGAVNYAKNLGFSAHRDYDNAKDIFGNVDNQDCAIDYEYGREGKPFYVQGPHESITQAQQIVATLHENCGEGNYHMMMAIG